MKTGNSLRRWKFLTAGLTVMTLGMSGILPVSASSMLSVTDEAQIRPIKDGSEKYLMKSDGFYCLKDDGSKDDTAAVHYFDHVKIDGTVLDGFYYHDESGCFQAGSSHMVKLTKLSCSENPDNAEEPVEFDGYYMVNNLGKLTAAPQVYNQNELCSKGDIRVGGSGAKSSMETCCESFKERVQRFVTARCSGRIPASRSTISLLFHRSS